MKNVSEVLKEQGLKVDQQVKQRWTIIPVVGDGNHGTEVGKTYNLFIANDNFTMPNGRKYEKGDWFLIEPRP
jgi:hypothetical protein